MKKVLVSIPLCTVIIKALLLENICFSAMDGLSGYLTMLLQLNKLFNIKYEERMLCTVQKNRREAGMACFKVVILVFICKD